MRPDGLPPIVSDRGHAPTRASFSCCLGEVRDGASAFRRESGRLTDGTRARRAACAEHLKATTGRSPSASERRSWPRSLPVLARDLVEAGLGKVEMLVEYQLPLTSMRADVVLAGVDARTGEDAYVVVELKQWSQADLYEDDERLVLVEGFHREAQPSRCSRYRATATTSPTSPESLGGRPTPSAASRTSTTLPTSTFRTSSTLATTERTPALHQDAAGRVPRVPSGAVRTRAVASVPVTGCSTARYARRSSCSSWPPRRSRIRSSSRCSPSSGWRTTSCSTRSTARAADGKEVVIVTGGPGSGKSVIALSLLGELCTAGTHRSARDRLPVVHADDAPARGQGLDPR